MRSLVGALLVLGVAAMSSASAQEERHSSRYVGCRAAAGVDARIDGICEVVDSIPSLLQSVRGQARRTAEIQSAHANALIALGDMGDDLAYRDCIEASRAAQVYFTRVRTPTRWAMSQVTMGQALTGLGERGDQTAANEAVEALLAAVDAIPRAQQPEFWAHARETLAGAYIVRGGGANPDDLRSAAAELRLALEIYRRPRFEAKRERAEARLAEIYRVLGEEPAPT